jgi:hypothetical protein
MATRMNEKFLSILLEFAVHRYGKLMEPAIRELAASLAAVSDYPLEAEEEPAFFS